MRFHDRIWQPEVAVQRFGELVPRLDAALDLGDPLADALFARWEVAPHERGDFRAALTSGIAAVGAPSPELRALFEAADRVPDWVDWSRILRGGRLFFRTGVRGGIVLGAKSLVQGYASPAGNKPLILTGRLERDVPRRLAETGVYVAATHAPDGLRRFGSGFASNLHVRMLHAMVRAQSRRNPRWNPEWGLPINQHDMVATILLFSTVWVEGVRKLGAIVSESDEADHCHLWRYAAHLIGVEPALVPDTVTGARELYAFIQTTEGPPDDDARRLVAAMLDAVPPGPGESFRRAFGAGMLRGLIGDEVATGLGVSRAVLPGVVPALGRLFQPLERLTLRSRRVERWRVAFGRRYWDEQENILKEERKKWASTGRAPAV